LPVPRYAVSEQGSVIFDFLFFYIICFCLLLDDQKEKVNVKKQHPFVNRLKG